MSGKLLFIGNSITQGKLGLNFVDMIKRRYPNSDCYNKGKGGETLLEITNRLVEALKDDDNQYSVIVIEAGLNDLLLPHIKQKWFFMNVKQVTPVSDFGILLEEKLKTIITLTNAKIVLTTLSCIGETYDSQLNQERRLINEQIVRIGHKFDSYIADVSSIFDGIIVSSNSSSYLLDKPINLLIDYFRSKKSKRADKISAKRNLCLTIDGVHLNSQGAKIYCKVISDILDDLI